MTRIEEEKEQTKNDMAFDSKSNMDTSMCKSTNGNPGGIQKMKPKIITEDDSDEECLNEHGEVIVNKPYTLSQLKVPNTCLVMENDTLLVKIPFVLHKMYKKHLVDMELENRDI